MIKFRAWDIKNGIMFLPDEVSFEMVNGVVFVVPHHKEKELAAEYFEIMQFTGLHDKNGKEIYECDIMQFCTTYLKYGYPDEVVKGEVSWSKEFAAFVVVVSEDEIYLLGDVLESDEECEVIGNIYENPELLKEGEPE